MSRERLHTASNVRVNGSFLPRYGACALELGLCPRWFVGEHLADDLQVPLGTQTQRLRLDPDDIDPQPQSAGHVCRSALPSRRPRRPACGFNRAQKVPGGEVGRVGTAPVLVNGRATAPGVQLEVTQPD